MNYEDFVNDLPGLPAGIQQDVQAFNRFNPVFVMLDGNEWEVRSVEEDTDGTIRIYVHE